MGQVILFCSGKGGTGKTGMCANIGIALGKKNNKVLLIDGCVGLRNLDIVLGLENKVLYNLLDVLEGSCELEQAILCDRRLINVSLLPCAWARDPGALMEEAFGKLISKIIDQYDYILIDCPSGIDYLFNIYAKYCDSILLIINQDVCSLRDADKVCSALRNMKKRDISIIINRYREDLTKKGIYLSLEDIEDLLGYSIIGVVPESITYMAGVCGGEPVCLHNSLICNVIEDIASRIMGQVIALPTPQKLRKIK